ncbi:MAG: transcriptional repressor [Phycisphaerae bacterium]|jgi:Fur family peroxide stress response transcriptional regulator
MTAKRRDNLQRWRQFEHLFRDRGMPLTIQRRAVLETVIARTDHPTADQVYDEVHDRVPGISRTTVYRVLDTLVRIGVIARTCHPGASARFDPNTGQHHHLICLHCDKVIDFDDKRLDAIKLPDIRRLGFEISEFRVQLCGICADCRKKKPTPKTKPARNSKKAAAGSTKRKKKTTATKKRRKTR